MNYALIGGTQSGCGKTSVTLALLQFLNQRQQSVRCFKTGPDFLDPMWHKAVTDKTSYNLDTNMMDIQQIQQIIVKHQDVEFGIIEGVMGLFDGKSGVGGKGSAAHLAKVLDVPVWLVVNAKGMSGSIVPLVKGFVLEAEDMGFRISGIIANRLGSENHARIIRELLLEHQLPPLIAWMEKNAPLLPERHLGLQMPDEHSVPDFSKVFHAELDLFKSNSDSLEIKPDRFLKPVRFGLKHIAIARDSACCFIYQSNLDWLQAQAAKISFFSPIAGDAVPDCDAIWLPGGYPELHAQSLSKSATWTSLAKHIEQGTPTLAECGGMMLLAENIIDHQGTSWNMAGILPITCRMQDRLAALGYRQDENSSIKGHEYHHSKRENNQILPKAYSLKRGDEGLLFNNCRASYIHWYFESAPDVAAQLFLRKTP
jgi:cobyrinic acid a,c-diamide synthase